MLFNSYIFVFLFFPICLAGYYGLLHLQKKEAAGIFLTAMSFWFYGYFNVSYLLGSCHHYHGTLHAFWA